MAAVLVRSEFLGDFFCALTAAGGQVHQIMENICQNCEYFVPVSVSSDRYAFGDCTNPQTSIVDESGSRKGVFTWADGTCLDFKPKKRSE
jgi:hypothetical protein